MAVSGVRITSVRGASLNGPIRQTKVATPQETVSTFSIDVDEKMNGDSATHPPTTAAPMRARLSDRAASDSSVTAIPATIALARCTGPSGSITANIGSQLPIRTANDRESMFEPPVSDQQQIRFHPMGRSQQARTRNFCVRSRARRAVCALSSRTLTRRRGRHLDGLVARGRFLLGGLRGLLLLPAFAGRLEPPTLLVFSLERVDAVRRRRALGRDL